MISFIPEGLALLFTLQGLIALVVGTAFGIVMGAIPGIGPTVAMAMVLPFTLGMENAPAIILLISIYAGSIYGGSISAVLLNTPGTPQSAATALDGYAMASRGEAGQALGWATIASIIGGLVSGVILLMAAPQLALLALNFGPIEIFGLLLLGMTCIVSVSKGAMAKGLLAGALGIFLSLVGGDPITGEARFTFGIPGLIGGLNFVAILLGVFAVTEVLVRLSAGRTDRPTVMRFGGIVLPGLSQWRGRWKGLAKSTAIGCGIGILPGAGASAAAFVSYAEARRSSPHGDRFGAGEPDGIIASEAANNAVTGGALVPTMALGIPGDAATAMLLAVLTLHGVTPGVRLMQNDPALIVAIFLGFLVINLLLLPIGLSVARAAVPILRLDERAIMIVISLLCFVGAYLVRSNMMDIWVMVGAGLAGFAMRRQGYPMAPLVVGMILGPPLEVSLRQGLIITDGNILRFASEHPIALVLFTITALVLLWPAASALTARLRRP